MNKILLGILIVFIAFAGIAYWKNNTIAKNLQTETNQMPVTSGENPQPGSSVHDLPVEPAAAVARKDLATRLGISEKNIVIMNIAEKTWDDGCLGLGGANESCIQALIPGFQVEMLAKGKTYFYRTDKTGNSIRFEK